MLAYIMLYGFKRFIYGVSRYDLYSTLHFVSDCVANCRNRLTITPHRALSATKCNALYRLFNCGVQNEQSK